MCGEREIAENWCLLRVNHKHTQYIYILVGFLLWDEPSGAYRTVILIPILLWFLLTRSSWFIAALDKKQLSSTVCFILRNSFLPHHCWITTTTKNIMSNDPLATNLTTPTAAATQTAGVGNPPTQAGLSKEISTNAAVVVDGDHNFSASMTQSRREDLRTRQRSLPDWP